MNFLALGYFGYFFNKTFCTEKYKILSILDGITIHVVREVSHENTINKWCMENPYVDVWKTHT